jgi:hypothetical protein
MNLLVRGEAIDVFFFWGRAGGFAIVVIISNPTNYQPLALVYRRRMMANILQIVQTAAFIAWCSILAFRVPRGIIIFRRSRNTSLPSIMSS